MIRSKPVPALAAVLVTLLLSAAPSFAAGQLHVLVLQGIPGDSLVQIELAGSPVKGIEVASFSWGVANPVVLSTNTGPSSGKPAFSDFTVLLAGGRAVPELFLRTATGQHIPLAKFVVFDNTGDALAPRYELTFTDVVLSSFQSSGSAGGEIFHSVSMAYAQLELKIYFQAPDGTVMTESRTFSLVENKKK
jgi:type VI secretion system secreted protein Hcp